MAKKTLPLDDKYDWLSGSRANSWWKFYLAKCENSLWVDYAPINVKPAGRDFDRSLWPGGRAFEFSCCPGGRDIWIFVRARDHKSFLGVGNLVIFALTFLPGGREFDCNLLENVKIPLDIDRCIILHNRDLLEKFAWARIGSHSYWRGSFIYAAGFDSVKNLADYLNYLDNNDTAYNQYFKWKTKYKVVKYELVPTMQGPHIILRNRPKFITKCLSIYEIPLYLNCGWRWKLISLSFLLVINHVSWTYQ